MSTGCETAGEDQVDSSPVTLEIRFQDDTAATQQPSTCLRGFTPLAAAPAAHAADSTTHDTVTRILVDISLADSGQPFVTNFELAPDVWRGNVSFLPRNQQLRFAARALNASGDIAFSGETLATLTVDNHDLQIPLAPIQNTQIFRLPRIPRILYPFEMSPPNLEGQVTFTIEGNVGSVIGFQITAIASPTTPAAELSPATGTVTLTSTVADLMTVYTAPAVTVDTVFDYQITVTDISAQSAATITTNFHPHITPRPSGGANKSPTLLPVRFNPVILGLTANDSETSGTVELVAAVSDDTTPDKLAFQWSYVPSTGTPAATFANHGQGNPGLFQGYTLAHQGTLTLAVADEHNGTTTLRWGTGADGRLGRGSTASSATAIGNVDIQVFAP
jgi:hypothetical protein